MSYVIYCAGDSWTYGQGLTDRNSSFCNQLADMINCDCYNYGINGGSNSNMLNQISKRVDEINNSKYDEGYIVLTFTENGRDIREADARPFDYIQAYKDLTHDYDFYTKVIDDIENEWIERLDILKDQLDSRFRVVTGCNFAKPKNLKLDIEEPWVQLLGYKGNIPRLTYVETTNTLNEIISIKSSDSHKQWLIDNGDKLFEMYDFFENSEFMLEHDSGHPNETGHKIWADRIYNELHT